MKILSVGLMVLCIGAVAVGRGSAGGRGHDLSQAERLGARPGEVVLSGEQLKAFLVAYGAFRKIPDLARRKKRLENYHLFFGEEDGEHFITFAPKLTKKDLDYAGLGETELGRTVYYWIRKKDYRITRWGYGV